jgi:hypothetical protein
MENVPLQDVLWRVCFRRQVWPASATYDAAQDAYRCPQGQLLLRRQTKIHRSPFLVRGSALWSEFAAPKLVAPAGGVGVRATHQPGVGVAA